MRRTVTQVCLAAVVTACFMAGCSNNEPLKTEPPQKGAPPPAASLPQELPQSGEALFRQFCFSCHPDGGNVSDPKRSLRGADLRKNHLTAPEDIVRIMRNPISRMIRFDPGTVPDREARIIAEYVLSTFR